MIRAYDKDYLPGACDNLGVMLDYAVGCCGMDLRVFYDRFLGSGVAGAIEAGHPRFLAGLSGLELAAIVLENSGSAFPFREEYSFPAHDSRLYWTGWALCRYQWFCARPFEEIDRSGLSVETVAGLFNPLHEADVSKVMEVFDARCMPAPLPLRQCRKALGMSQQELAEKSGVSQRMIRAYEQGSQDIKRAETATVLRLSKVLRCPPERIVGL